MEIQQINDISKGSFKIAQECKEAGILTYIWDNANKFTINHTIVHEGFNGKGIGKKLVMAAVEYARENNFKIVPKCYLLKQSLINQKVLEMLNFKINTITGAHRTFLKG